MSDASATLRRAAKILRGHAEAATAGPWESSHGPMMETTVGLALADWLDAAAEHDETPCPAADHALAVARAVLREDERHDDS